MFLLCRPVLLSSGKNKKTIFPQFILINNSKKLSYLFFVLSTYFSFFFICLYNYDRINFFIWSMICTEHFYPSKSSHQNLTITLTARPESISFFFFPDRVFKPIAYSTTLRVLFIYTFFLPSFFLLSGVS